MSRLSKTIRAWARRLGGHGGQDGLKCVRPLSDQTLELRLAGNMRVRHLGLDWARCLVEEIFIHGEYAFTADRSDPYILDCGGNIGLSVLYFKQHYPQSNVVVFEPDGDAFACLQENIKWNGLVGVEAHPVAVCGREGPVDFYSDPVRPGSPLMSTQPGRMPSSQRRVVPGVLLSRYMDRPVDFLKMDVEGSELEILEEVALAGKLPSVKQMAIEYHHHIEGDRDEMSRLLVLLEQGGFGYQIAARLPRPLRRGVFQDVLIYAYRKQTW